MIIPETIIYNFLGAILVLVNSDYNAATDKAQSLLGLMFQNDDNNTPITLSTFNFFDQAVSILIRDNTNVRKIGVNIGYNLERLKFPTVHILLPNENPGDIDGIGIGEGYKEETVYEDTGKITVTHTPSFRATYNLMLTSDNSSEVLVLYNFLKAILEIFKQELQLLGLINLDLSGSDVQFESDLVPPNIFHRNLSLSFLYESSYSKLIDAVKANKISAEVCSDFYLDFIKHNIQQGNITGINIA